MMHIDQPPICVVSSSDNERDALFKSQDLKAKNTSLERRNDSYPAKLNQTAEENFHSNPNPKIHSKLTPNDLKTPVLRPEGEVALKMRRNLRDIEKQFSKYLSKLKGADSLSDY